MIYYTLCVLHNSGWSPEFGDYDRETVVEERDEYPDLPTIIIATGSAKQSLINEAVAELNRKLKETIDNV